VQIYDITNGNRLTTYAISGEPGSGMVCINGAAAHMVHPGDLIIIASYAQYSVDEVGGHDARIILVDQHNRIVPPASAIQQGEARREG
jgi:aspartate 1-decarboxylase